MKARNTDYLDGVRGICCMIVVIDHAIGMFKPDLRFTSYVDGGFLQRLIALSPLNFIYNGTASVCMFFILSGFVLSFKFFRFDSFSNTADSVLRRYPRLIIPVLFSSILMFVLYKLCNTLFGAKFNVNFGELVWQSLYLAPFFHVPLENGALWTISYEIYGSLLVFSILSIFGGSKLLRIICIIVFLFFFSTFSFYCLFIFGLYLCEKFCRGGVVLSAKLRLFLVFVGIFLISLPYPRDGVDVYAGIYSCLQFLRVEDYSSLQQTSVMLGCMAIFLSIIDNRCIGKFFDKKIFRFLGKISFSLYLIHYCFLAIFRGFILHYFAEINLTIFAFSFVLAILVIVPCSYIFYILIDRMSIKISKKLSQKILRNNI